MSTKTRKEKNLGEKAVQVVSIIVEGCLYHGETSVIYNQKTILKKAERDHGRIINRRQLNYDLKDLEEAGYIKRYKRHRYSEKDGYEFRSTRSYLQPKAWLLAARLGKIAWKMAYKMIAAIKKGKQRTMVRAGSWVTPDWMYEYLPFDIRPAAIPDG